MGIELPSASVDGKDMIFARLKRYDVAFRLGFVGAEAVMTHCWLAVIQPDGFFRLGKKEKMAYLQRYPGYVEKGSSPSMTTMQSIQPHEVLSLLSDCKRRVSPRFDFSGSVACVRLFVRVHF